MTGYNYRLIMYRPSLRPGEELVTTSPGVTVKNVVFDAFLTSKRIIFVKQTDNLQERKELVFPLNLVKDFKPSSDESGTPDIRFSIEKPSGEVGDLILRFIQTGDYRYAERDDWIENLKKLSRGIVPRNSRGGDDLFSGDMAPKGSSSGTIPSPGADLYDGTPDMAFTPPPGGFQQQPAAPPTPPVPEPSFFQGEQPRPAPAPDAQSTMFCRFCGAKVPSGSVFCPSCGGKLGGQAEQPRPAVFSQPPPQSPPVNRQQASPPPVMSGNGGFIAPPPPPPVQNGYGQQPPLPPRNVGISLADDRAYDGASMSPKDNKTMMKQQAKAEKARLKEQKKAQKAAGYDPYAGYSESRIPEGLPKMIIIAIAVIAVIAIAGYVFTSGMLGGGDGTGTTPAPGNSQSTSGVTTNPTNPLGSTTVSENYGKWLFTVQYPGEWSGSYTVNGATTTITDDYGETPIFGTKPDIPLGEFSGTIEITATILDGGAGGTLKIFLNDDNGVPVDDAEASGPDGTAILTYP